jgi:beta-D-galactosyl-(1->4)-L-rhamnose phosphorylase
MQHRSVYNQFLESLSGLPVEVDFLSLAEIVAAGVPEDVDVIVNCGRQGTAWSGGEAWRDPRLVEAVSEFVAGGGGLVGIGEPSALEGAACRFQLAHVLGVDREPLAREANVEYDDSLDDGHFVAADAPDALEFVHGVGNLVLRSPDARVVNWDRTGECRYFYEYLQPRVVVNAFEEGRSVYFSGFKYNADNTRALHRALLWAAEKEDSFDVWRTDNVHTECACFPGAGQLVVVNNSREEQRAKVLGPGGGELTFDLPALGMTVTGV